MEAPKGRYSVVEKDGRLIVIDNQTGAAAASTTPSPRPGTSGRVARAGPSRPIANSVPAKRVAAAEPPAHLFAAHLLGPGNVRRDRRVSRRHRLERL